jgi:hypothetical protein
LSNILPLPFFLLEAPTVVFLSKEQPAILGGVCMGFLEKAKKKAEEEAKKAAEATKKAGEKGAGAVKKAGEKAADKTKKAAKKAKKKID